MQPQARQVRIILFAIYIYKLRIYYTHKVNKMLNGKEIKSIKNMVITVTPWGAVFSGGSVTFNSRKASG